MPVPVVHRDGPHAFGRDTPAALGTELRATCTDPAHADLHARVHRLEDRDELMRDHVFRLVRDLAQEDDVRGSVSVPQR